MKPPRILPAEEARLDPPECNVNADCGERAHAEMTCFHDGSCMPICEAHWADCNHDYTDGCETPTKHPHYCDGDPRIEAEKRPSPDAMFVPVGSPEGPGKMSPAAFDRGLGVFDVDLMNCYSASLAKRPMLDGAFEFAITVTKSGCLQWTLTNKDIDEPDLQHCVESIFARVRFGRAPKGGAVTFVYKAIFSAGLPGE